MGARLYTPRPARALSWIAALLLLAGAPGLARAGNETKAREAAADAGMLLDQGNLKAAEAKASLALSLDNESPEARFQIARIRLREGKLPEAYTVLMEATRKTPLHVPCQRLLIRVMQLGGQSVTGRVTALEALVAKHPDDLGLKLALGDAYLAAGKVPSAMKAARDVLTWAETSVGALKILARAYLASQRPAAAKAVLKRAVELGKDAEARFLLAGLSLAKGDYLGARGLLEEATEQRPGFVEALNDLGLVYLKARNWDAATEVLAKATAVAPAFAAAWLNLGAAQRGGGHFTEAEASWKHVLELDPKMVDAWYNLGILYLENPLPGHDREAQLGDAVRAFSAFKQGAPPGTKMREVNKYLGEAKLLIKQEQQRKQEELKEAPEDDGGGDGADEGADEGADGAGIAPQDDGADDADDASGAGGTDA